MSLSADDLLAIRTIVSEEIAKKIEPLEGRVTALENDVKEIYRMIAKIELNIKRLDANMQAIAKYFGVKLPQKLTF